MSFTDRSCDTMVLNHVLDCMPDDRPAVSEMFRILRSGKRKPAEGRPVA